MNFLAHAHLSFAHPSLLVGNMISDFVKGKKQFEYEKDILAGIRLHRRIDEFTDAHPATAAAKNFFRPHYRLYSGAIIDILYDHFLANDANEFSPASLLSFSSHVYQTLEAHSIHLPPRFLAMLPYMKAQNWLYHYMDKEGIAKSIGGMVRRSAYLSDADTAFYLFQEHYKELQICYDAFFGDVKSFANQQLAQLLL